MASREARDIAARLGVLCAEIERDAEPAPLGANPAEGISELPTRERRRI